MLNGEDFNVGDLLIESLNEAVEMARGRYASKNSIENTDVEPIPVYSAAEIKKIRLSHKLSLQVMSRIIGTTPRSIRKWEAGDNPPNKITYRMYQMISKHPEIIQELIKDKSI